MSKSYLRIDIHSHQDGGHHRMVESRGFLPYTDCLVFTFGFFSSPPRLTDELRSRNSIPGTDAGTLATADWLLLP